jgi:hypothetical protein
MLSTAGVLNREPETALGYRGAFFCSNLIVLGFDCIPKRNVEVLINP